MSDLALGQLIALAVAVPFLAIEYLRLKNLALAALEALRFWAFIAAAELTFWIAMKGDSIERALIIALGTILAALLINNAYLRAYRTYRRDE